MAKTSVPRRKAKPSPPIHRVTTDAEGIGYLKTAAEMLAKGSQSLRIAAALFDDEGRPTAAAPDLHYAANEVLSYLNNAATQIFEFVSVERAALAINEGLYDLIDVMTLVCYGLKDGEYPPSAGVSTSPVAGGISVVRQALPQLAAKLDRCIDQAIVSPARRRRGTLRGQEARS